MSLKTTLKTPAQRLTSIALSAFVGLSFSACAFSENPGAGTPPPVKTGDVLDTLQNEKDKEVASGKLTSENVSVTFEENPSAGSYRMIIRWPKPIQHVTVSVNTKLPIIVRNSDYVELNVESDTDYKIDMIAYGNVSSSPMSSLALSARSPKDLIFSETINYTEDRILTARRVFFKASGRIVTNGNSLVINTEKIYATASLDEKANGTPFVKYSHILTRPIDTLAKTEGDLAGGNITINAKEAHGDLLIAMVGVNGRKGPSGLQVEEKMNPRPSRIAAVDPSLNGVDGVETLVGMKCLPGRGSFNDSTGCGQALGCTTPPQSGRDGSKGKQGTHGERGEDGGSFGKLVVSIDDSRNLRVDVGTMNGAPGIGGEGAPGFPGTVGGRAGSKPGSCSAFASNKGADGPAGDTGDVGPSGGVTAGGSINGGRTPIRIFEISR